MKHEDKKYLYIVICSGQNGTRAQTEVYRDKKLETSSDFFELQNSIREHSPEVRNLMIENIMCFENK